MKKALKKQKNKLILPVIAGWVLTLSTSCGKEQPPVMEEAEDPCDCATEVSANFLIEEMTTGNTNFALYTDTDTILKNKNVRFTALEQDAEYTWYLGTEVVNDQQVIRYFSDGLAGINQTISLVVNKTPNTNCFPDDDGYDSISRPLNISSYPIDNGSDLEYGSIEGTYRVYIPAISDSADITLDIVAGHFGAPTLNFYNYDGVGSNAVYTSGSTLATGLSLEGINYRQLWVEPTITEYNYLGGDIYLSPNMKVEMHLSFGSSNPNSPDYYETIYSGRKI
ncbi:hypothetical protein [Parvicella tangerina]|uniref:Lipoprotein n=1 Tax=Parvicella tangerina TaxID=2829795 RepID=A0A916NDM6_9FLAO|nr:hypothetical protein [Parvicella tangerina]CAG5086967.1 hypothetical protein CRYO30217_03353 [Parvicella tangerina]